MYFSVPPKFSSAAVEIGFLKGKSEIRIHRGLLKINKIGAYMAAVRPTVSNSTGDLEPLFEKHRSAY